MEDNEQEEGATPQDQWQGPQTTSMDDIEEMVTEKPQQNLLETELQGDAVPEEFRGKKFSDVLGSIQNFKNALKASEEARSQAMLTAQALAENRPTAQQAPLVAQPQAVERSAEQWRELYDSDPFKYQEERFTALEKRLAQGLESRVAPMASASASNAEQTARSKFPEEFQVLGKEIKDFVQMAFPSPEARQTLADPEAWGRVVKYVRGENVDKWIEYKNSKVVESATAQRRQAEAQAAPPALSTSRNGAPAHRPQGKLMPGNMDEVQKEIARNLMPDLPPLKAYEEYCKHYI